MVDKTRITIEEERLETDADRTPISFPSFVIHTTTNNMDKVNNTTPKLVQAFLNENIANFAEYANQVIHDDEFVKRVNELLPFEDLVCASINVLPKDQIVRKMGIGVMRIDIQPPLFSLAVTMTIDHDGKEEGSTVFINVIEGIEGLQAYVSSKEFQTEVVNANFAFN